MQIDVGEKGVIELSEVYCGVVIRTDAGRFGVCQRDGGIEVTRHGEQVFSCYHLGSPTDGDEEEEDEDADRVSPFLSHALDELARSDELFRILPFVDQESDGVEFDVVGVPDDQWELLDETAQKMRRLVRKSLAKAEAKRAGKVPAPEFDVPIRAEDVEKQVNEALEGAQGGTDSPEVANIRRKLSAGAEWERDLLEDARLLLAELDATRAEAANWKETAAQYARNEEFYRDIVEQIGEMFGEAARTSDDGSIQDSVLALKVPALVAAALDSVPLSRHRCQHCESWMGMYKHGCPERDDPGGPCESGESSPADGSIAWDGIMTDSGLRRMSYAVFRSRTLRGVEDALRAVRDSARAERPPNTEPATNIKAVIVGMLNEAHVPANSVLVSRIARFVAAWGRARVKEDSEMRERIIDELRKRLDDSRAEVARLANTSQYSSRDEQHIQGLRNELAGCHRTIAELRSLAEANELEAHHSGGILSDVCDLAFDVEGDWATKDYEGIRDRIRELVAKQAKVPISWHCPKCAAHIQSQAPCCNPECQGQWGTGCYHCHHPSYLPGREEA